MMKVSYPIVATSLAMALSWGMPAIAQTAPDTGQVSAGTYHVDPNHTQVVFSVLHLGFSHYTGLLSGIKGTMILDPVEVKNTSLSIDIPLSSLLTTSAKLNDELKGKEWFDAEKFPTAHFSATKIVKTGKDSASVEGALTLHGVTKPEILKVRFIGAGTSMMSKKYTTGFEAQATIKRSDFGVKMFVPYVEDNVDLRIAGAFEKDN
ncbi:MULTISPECIES: YceI family protein [unclassified Saccharibacter]|uniref:YceI family protein n=1 Tax=unclassified Saccharibacter TaxID=2648722 RepID=UPI00132AAF97|nr:MULTISPECIES: YceI family protein [unclassified Saccharibacter]MXV35334.1 polyisoprenoid-binding protein [Saccharibacter sp. EH611]MXV57818.1 polyisoprenoid-binding protein [Saccharibacter sp. EH70]MXV65268.1 polyisoprenoid-binding protein [Saccharibacter sp. EH60]